MKVFTIMNHKGGVGKTTLAIHLAAAIANSGRKALLIDADGQGSASVYMMGGERPDFYDLLIRDKGWDDAMSVVDPQHYASTPPAGQLYMVLGNGETSNIANKLNRIMLFRKRLDEIRNVVDAIIIDTSPTPTLLHSSILVATDYVILPTNAEALSEDGLNKSLAQIQDTHELVGNTNFAVPIGIVPTMYRQQTGLHQAMLQSIADNYPTLNWPGLPQRIVYGEAAYYKQTVFAYAPKDEACQDMMKLFKKVEPLL